MPPARFLVNGMIKTIIFDFDGVLVESFDIKTIAFARLFEVEGDNVVRRVVEYHRAHGGVSRYEKFRYYYRELLKRELTEERFQELCSRFSELVLQEVVKSPYVLGAKEFLDTHASRIPCFVTSATPEQELLAIIRQRGMEHYFRGIYGAPKSKSDAVEEILVQENIEPLEALYVGDAFADYDAAVKNQIHFVARCDPNNRVLDTVECRKIPDLTVLYDVVEEMI